MKNLHLSFNRAIITHYQNYVHNDINSHRCIIAGLHWSGTAAVMVNNTESGAAGVFTWAAPLSVLPIRQSSGTVPLWTGTACTVFPSGTGAMTNQSGNLIYFRWIFASFVWVKGKLDRAANSNLLCHWLSLTRRWRNSACRIGTLPLNHRKLTPTWRPV